MAPEIMDQYDIPERRGKLAVFDGHYATDIPRFVAEWKTTRIVLVMSKTLHSQSNDMVRELQTGLAGVGAAIVGTKIGVGAHSPYRDVLEIAHILQGTKAVCLVSVGSGSYSDACKIASRLATELPSGFTEQDMEQLVDQKTGLGHTCEARIKVILVPTSLSAGEWNGTSSCTNTNGKKQHFAVSGSHKKGAADVVLCDPELASTSPPLLWLSSGMRCVDHCVETVCNKACSSAAEKDALQGLAEMAHGLIERHASKGPSLHGISQAQRGSRLALKALIVEGNSFGPSHAIGHQLGAVAKVMHGVTSCVMMPAVLRYNAEKTDNPSFSRARQGQAGVLRALNEALGWNESSAGDAVARLVRTLELPGSLRDVGVTEDEQMDRIAERTMTDVWGGGEVQIKEVEEVRRVLDMAR